MDPRRVSGGGPTRRRTCRKSGASGGADSLEEGISSDLLGGHHRTGIVAIHRRSGRATIAGGVGRTNKPPPRRNISARRRASIIGSGCANLGEKIVNLA